MEESKSGRELQLPERLHYYPGITVTRSSGRNIIHASIDFVDQPVENAACRAKYRLYYLPSAVSPNARNIAQLQEGTMQSLRR